ncbi:MAG: hypothetical protein NW201_05395, partial [Gemmatimonadales bacterium]|nr:hypothetical protein [Gemmatimonadales bacterium]
MLLPVIAVACGQGSQTEPTTKCVVNDSANWVASGLGVAPLDKQVCPVTLSGPTSTPVFIVVTASDSGKLHGIVKTMDLSFRNANAASISPHQVTVFFVPDGGPKLRATWSGEYNAGSAGVSGNTLADSVRVQVPVNPFPRMAVSRVALTYTLENSATPFLTMPSEATASALGTALIAATEDAYTQRRPITYKWHVNGQLQWDTGPIHASSSGFQPELPVG